MPSIECCLAQDGSSGGGLNEDSVSHRRGQSLLRGDPCGKGRVKSEPERHRAVTIRNVPRPGQTSTKGRKKAPTGVNL